MNYAQEHSAKAQESYAKHYNRRSRDKAFKVGESVLILAPDSTTSKVFARWQGPALVTRVISPYSYLVELGGKEYRLHANKLRKFQQRIEAATVAWPCADLQVDTCAVIFDRDIEFGDVPVIDAHAKIEMPSSKMAPEALAHLSVKQRHELLEVLDRYAVCFQDIPGYTDKVIHNIVVTSDFRPRRMHSYRVPERLKPDVEAQLADMLKLGIIRPSKSPMASPLVCVAKPDGSTRLAVDYRYLNKYTVSDEYPVPDIASIFQRIGHSKILSSFDCRSGYWQTPVNPDHIWLTAFVCDAELFEFTRTPFGCKNAGRTFIRAMEMITKPLKGFCESYVDDNCVHSPCWKRHLIDVEGYLRAIKQAGVTLSLKKCRFGFPQIVFCGTVVGSGSRFPDPGKTTAIDEVRDPVTKTDLRRILGLFNYFREYVPKFAELAKPLTDLTGKATPQRLPWTVEHSTALDQLKNALIEAVKQPLYIIDWDKSFTIFVDASNYAVAGILTQPDELGGYKPIAFHSAKLNQTQQNWATIEREAYACLSALKRFRSWIFGAPEVTIMTDHNPLLYLCECAPKSAKLMRWSLALQEFGNLVFRYKTGKTNVAADCLSRTEPR